MSIFRVNTTMMTQMRQRLLDGIALLLFLLGIFMAIVWLRSHFYGDSLAYCPNGTFVRIDSLPGKIRLEWAPDWPYPQHVVTGWKSWRHSQEHPAPVLGAGSTNALGFGYDHSVALVVTEEEAEAAFQPPSVSDYVLIAPFWAIVVSLLVIPAILVRSRFRTKRSTADEG